MRIGIVSDTHDRSEAIADAVRLLAEQQVELILHCGDIESLDTIQLFKPVPTHFVFGNWDRDRVRMTAGGKTRDGKHRLSNGSFMTVQGFTRQGDIILDHGWVLDKDFGHLTHGYVVTSHASQGATVDKVFVAISSESVPATNQRTAYVAITRGKEQAVIFTDDKEALLKAIGRPDNPLSATELSGMASDSFVQMNPARLNPKPMQWEVDHAP